MRCVAGHPIRQALDAEHEKRLVKILVARRGRVEGSQHLLGMCALKVLVDKLEEPIGHRSWSRPDSWRESQRDTDQELDLGRPRRGVWIIRQRVASRGES